MSNKVLNATALMFGGNHEEAIQELKNADMNRVKVLAMLLDCYLYTEQFENAYAISTRILEQFSESNLHEGEYVYLEKARDIVKSYKNSKIKSASNKKEKNTYNDGKLEKIFEDEKLNLDGKLEEELLVYESETKALLAAKEALNEGEFEKIIKIIEDNNLKDIMSQVLLADCYLMLGEFVIAVDNYNRIVKTCSRDELDQDEYEYLEKAEKAVAFYEDIGLDEYDVYLKGKDTIQSIERPDESYPESDYYQSIINCRDENKKNKMMEDLFSEKVLTEPEEKERSYFAIGEFYFGSDNNDDFLKAFGYYYEAIKLNPNKALYYGYAANSLYRYYIKKQISGEAKDELIYILGYRSSKFAKRAIELDPRNPRWYFYQNLALSSLIVHNPNFIRQAIKDNQIALSLCRSDQRALKQAVLKSSETLNSGIDILGNAGALILEKPEEEDKKDKVKIQENDSSSKNNDKTSKNNDKTFSSSDEDIHSKNKDNLKEKDLNKSKESIEDIYISDDLKEFSDSEEMKKARLTMYDRDFEEAIEILKKCNKDNIKVLYMLAQSYMYSGQLDLAYENYEKITYKLLYESNLRDNEIKYLKIAEEFIGFLKKHSYTSKNHNIRMKGENVEQSIERSDGTYEESEYAFLYINGRSDSVRRKVFQNIQEGLDSFSDSVVEASRFRAGEIFYHSEKNFENAYGMYNQAAQLSPNKALYFGYASRAMDRQRDEYFLRNNLSREEADMLLNFASLLASKFATRAIELDFKNPRWHLYQSKALGNLLRWSNNYIFQVEKEIDLALNLCRNDQEKLKKEIKNHKEYISSKKKYIKEEELVFYKERKLEVKRKEMIQNRINKYWEYNIKEKNKLEKEKNELENKIDTLNHQESLINEDRTIEELSESLKILNKEKTRIFIFKKRKEEIDLEIDKTANKIKKLNEEKNIDIAKIRDEIECLKEKLIEINNELTKER